MQKKINKLTQNIINRIPKFAQSSSRFKEYKYIEDFIQKALNFNDTIQKADTDSHLITCFSIVIALKAKKILELGVRRGNTTLAFLYGAKFTGGFVESVDINPTSFKPPEELKRHWKFCQSDAVKYLENIPEGFIYDVVFVDDWHAYEHVSKELGLLRSHVNKSSIILLHDLMHTFTHPNYIEYDTLRYHKIWKNEPYKGHKKEFADGGPYRAVNELDKDLWEFSTIPVCHGLTILRKKR